jgi:hypothetical protein
MSFKIESCGEYRTRAGLKAVVVSLKGTGRQSILGYIQLQCQSKDLQADWFSDGCFLVTRAESSNDIVGKWFELPDPGEGWRLLVIGEKLQEGDQFFNGVNDWVQAYLTLSAGFVQHGHFYRRRNAPLYVPYTWEDRDLIRGRWFRFKDKSNELFISYMRLEHGVFYIEGVVADAMLKSCEWLDGTPCGKKVTQ